MAKTLNPNSWFGTPEEKERAIARRITDEKEQAIALEEINFKYGHTDQHTYDKNMATHKGEQYVYAHLPLHSSKKYIKIDFNT